jgi:putative colanic acid biosynthesis UDP-glucose lipid carrier transferase
MKSGTLRQYTGVLATGQRLTDAVVIISANAVTSLAYVGQWTQRDVVLAIVALVSYGVVAESNGVYRSWRGAQLRDELRVALWTWVLTGPLMLLWLFATKTSEDYSRVVAFSWFIGAGVLLAALRSLKNSALGFLRINGRNSRTAGIIGATPLAMKLRRELADPAHGIQVKGIYDFRSSDRVSQILGDEELTGDFEEAVQAARNGELDFIYITLPLKAESRIGQAVAALADTTATVQLVTDFSAFDLLRARWASVGSLPAVSLFDTPFNGSAAFMKRLEDLFLGTLFLLLASPVMLLVAIAIKCTTRGPVFFSQTRYGLGGRPIKVLKFRSMTTADDGDNVVQATKGDLRVTRIGAFLRSSSLDELPQLLNVLRGDMSIVGPRPHAVAHNEEFRSLIHGYMLRHKVKPGITGWAQVNGLRGETDTIDKMRARVEYDLEYIENWDLRWDLEIIFRTAFRVWKDRNAY